jgi:hypothetical protein
MPGRSGVTVVTNSCVYLFHTRGCGRIARPAFPAPSDFERVFNQQLGRLASRERSRAREHSSSLRTQGPITTGVRDAKIVCHIVSIESTTRYGSRRAPGRRVDRYGITLTNPRPTPSRHHPPPGLAFGEPDDRLQRVIQYPGGSSDGIEKPRRTGSPGQAGRRQLGYSHTRHRYRYRYRKAQSAKGKRKAQYSSSSRTSQRARPSSGPMTAPRDPAPITTNVSVHAAGANPCDPLDAPQLHQLKACPTRG